MVKERISLTLDGDVVERLDRRLEREGISNRSRGVEKLLKEVLSREQISTALVLGGGIDSSCLINVNGKPVIEHAIDYLRESGVDEIFVATADPDVKEALGGAAEINVIFEDDPLGTGGSLREVRNEVKDTFLVMNGDVLCEVDLEDMYRAHRDGDGMATVALTTVEDSSAYGVVRMKGNKVVGFKEKPQETSSHLVNAGVYLLDPEFLKRVPDTGETDIETIFEQVAADGELNGYVYEGEWRDVG